MGSSAGHADRRPHLHRCWRARHLAQGLQVLFGELHGHVCSDAPHNCPLAVDERKERALAWAGHGTAGRQRAGRQHKKPARCIAH